MARHGMSDRGWEFIKHLFPEPERPQVGRPWVEHRQILDGIFWILRTGAPWRDLPVEFGAWETVYGRLRLWSRDGTIGKVFDKIIALLEERGDLDWELWCLDGTIIRAARCAGGARKKTTYPTNRRTMPWVGRRGAFRQKST